MKFMRTARTSVAVLMASTALGATMWSGLAKAQVSPTQPAAAAGGSVGQLVVAQTQTSGADQPEVVVTARRRSENIERVPLAITAFDAKQITERSISSEADLQSAVPGLIVRSTQSQNSLNFALRGQTVDAFTGSSPAVLTYVNDVVANPSGASSLFDLSSIQVVKGPQGTLFGRNTTGGAVLYGTAKPGDTLGGFITERLGNYGLTETIGAVDLPVSDKVRLRFAADLINENGYIHDIANDTHLGATNRASERVTLELKPNAQLENITVVEYDATAGNNTGDEVYTAYPCGAKNGNIALNTIGACLYSPLLDSVIGFPGAWNAFLAAHPGANPGGIIAATAAQNKLGAYAVDTPAVNYHHGHDYFVDNTTTYKLNSSVTFKNILGVSDSATVDRADNIGLPFPLFVVYNPASGLGGDRNKSLDWSDEAQVIGNAFVNLDYIAGVYFSRQTFGVRDDGSYFDLTPIIPPTDVTQAFKETAQSQGIFVQGTYDLGPLTSVSGLKFTAGVRYTWEQDSLEQGNVAIARANTAAAENVQFSDPSWQVGFDYQVNSNLLLYIVQRGSWRSGGFNGFATPVNALASSGGNLYLPETTYDVEAGEKYSARPFGMPAQVNLAIYNQWVDNAQKAEYFEVNGANVAATANVPAAEVTGFEADSEIKPLYWLSFGGSVAFTDARFTSAAVTSYGSTSVYGPYADSPRWSGGVHGQVALPAPTAWGDMTVRADIFAQSSVYFSNLNNTTNPGTKIPGYGLLNLRYDWNKVMGSDLTLALFAKNVLDKGYYTGGIGVGVDFGVNAVVPGTPQMFGAELTYRFGGH